MVRITVYDYDDERIQVLCEKYNLTEAEVIELLLDNVDGSEDIVFM